MVAQGTAHFRFIHLGHVSLMFSMAFKVSAAPFH
jgi:NADH:ubiquinone oxidoreductase subunit 2 (subunit N)